MKRVMFFVLAATLLLSLSSCKQEPSWEEPASLTDTDEETMSWDSNVLPLVREEVRLDKNATSAFAEAYGNLVCLQQPIFNGIENSPIWNDPELVATIDAYWKRILSEPGYEVTEADLDTLLLIAGVDEASFNTLVTETAQILENMIDQELIDPEVLFSEAFFREFISYVEAGDCSDPPAILSGEKKKVLCCTMPDDAQYNYTCIVTVCDSWNDCREQMLMNVMGIVTGAAGFGSLFGTAGAIVGGSAGAVGAGVYAGWKFTRCRMIMATGCGGCYAVP